MTALIYFLVAALAVALSITAFVEDRMDPSRQAFLAYSGALAFAYVGFSLSLLPGLGGFRALYLFSGCAVVPALLWTFDRTFFREDDRPVGAMRFVYVGTAVVAPVGTVLHVMWSGWEPRASPPGVVLGVFSFYGLQVAMSQLWSAQENATRVERSRLRYLFGVVAAAVLLTGVEQLGRTLSPSVDPGALSLSARGVALQGPVPPFSTLFVGLGTYFLYHSVVMSRLLDVTELLSRIATVLLSAFALVLIDGLTFLWVDTFTFYPLHSTVQIFLASILFLAAYDPLRNRIANLANWIFDRRSHQFVTALEVLQRQLPGIIDHRELVETLLTGMHASGRTPQASVYVWDQHHEAFVCAGYRGQQRPLQLVGAHPFTDRFARGAPWYLRSTVLRRAQNSPPQAEVLALMDAMVADLAMPLVRGDLVLGWLTLRDESWSDGYSAEEILRLQEIAGLASVVLVNVQGFAELEEQKRLVALGAMSAGLAHEIRNPLAGVKGAAQLLQGEASLGEEAREMLNVIVDETDRLNTVVSQFLDYARPFDLSLESSAWDPVVARALALVRAQGVPPTVTIVERLAADLPPVRIDPVRMTQVVLNLVQNGLQAMPQGGTLTVETRAGRDRLERRQVEIHVADTGGGITDEVKERLFVPFFTTKPHGTGLGLAICQRIVHAHGGEIDVWSVPGAGTAFVVRLPEAPRTDDVRG